ncbi:MAG: QueT transporter family protein [Clostridia bacterium]|nr:QueT transporter family protein [Clostridia bacterium]
MKKSSLYSVTRSAVISALYFCITMLTAPISFGPVQIRIGESLTLLPVLFPESAVGLAVGCALANISSPFGLLDVIVGSLVTLISGILSSKCKNVYVAGIFPVLLNALIIPAVWLYMGTEGVYFLNVLYLLLSQSIVVYLIGVPIVKAVSKVPALNKKD